MAFLEFKHVRIAGISAAVPKNVLKNEGDAVDSKDYDAEAFVKLTGVRERRIGNLTASDLCIPAAERLLQDLGWKKEEVEAVIFVTQHPDYIIPVTSCIVQGRLGLSEDCYCDDSKHGCSGWVYGLSHVFSLLENGNMHKALLCVGDGKRSYTDQIDPLMGHACVVTAIEYSEKEIDVSYKFHFGTEGSSFNYVYIPEGGARHPFTIHSFDKVEIDGRMYSGMQPQMNGADTFSLGITVMPKSVKKLADHFQFNYMDNDYFVFHQANFALNKMVMKKLKLDLSQCPMSLYEFGNTSSASIPMTIVTQLKGKIEDKPTKLLCGFFGTGMTWGSMSFTTDNIVISELVEVDNIEE